MPWSFALGGIIDPPPTTITSGALADIDGDGLADLCSLRDRDIAARAARVAASAPPPSSAPCPPARSRPRWLGDLDGNGTADACVEDASTIRCVR